MIIYENEDIIVQPSAIEGYGVFAKRGFKAGEVVLRWQPTRLNEKELLSMSEEEKRYVNKLEDGSYVLMNIPERYINSADEPNTQAVGESDIALKDIKIGEEITTHYNF